MHKAIDIEPVAGSPKHRPLTHRFVAANQITGPGVCNTLKESLVFFFAARYDHRGHRSPHGLAGQGLGSRCVLLRFFALFVGLLLTFCHVKLPEVMACNTQNWMASLTLLVSPSRAFLKHH